MAEFFLILHIFLKRDLYHFILKITVWKDHINSNTFTVTKSPPTINGWGSTVTKTGFRVMLSKYIVDLFPQPLKNIWIFYAIGKSENSGV